ncbi:MAG: alanine dehydrogenase [Flavobacteriales bacterium TMED191]|nr:MAG: alanine dehydrogenase [Flavobacteriales bacterium TMED191]|tara:strand:+ start:2390 stop:3580 length:1191 start_codon:yes stop_codon:yes gene_type:complete
MGNNFLSFSEAGFTLPQEEVIELKSKNKKLTIGIPKEVLLQEKRIGLVPDAVNLLTLNNHSVIVQSGVGQIINFTDKDYSDCGARIVNTAKEVYQADIILKVSPPTNDEIKLMKQNQTLISALQLKIQKPDFFIQLMEKKITAIAYDYIQDEDGIFPVVRSMSEIAGNASVLIAAECLSNLNNGKGLLMGGVAGVSTTDIVILGAGTVGEFAARSTIGLGASVKIFDNSLYKLRRIQDKLNTRVDTNMINPKALEKAVRRADVVIGAIRTKSGRTPCVISEDMVKLMKPGSVVIDVSIDRGGCIETSEVTSHKSPTFIKHGVIHYCVPNIPSRVARTASFSLSNIFASLLLQIGDHGGVNQIIYNNPNIGQGAYIINGQLVNKGISDWFNLPYQAL